MAKHVLAIILLFATGSVHGSATALFETLAAHDHKKDVPQMARQTGQVNRKVALLETRKINATADAGTAKASDVKAQKEKLTPHSWFVLTLSTAFVVKTLCMVSNIFFQCSPFPAVKGFFEKGDTGQTDGAPYMAIMYGGSQWCFYGMYAFFVTEKSGFLVLVYSNVGGSILGMYYVWAYIKNCKDQSMLRRFFFYMQIAACLAAMQVGAMMALPCQKALFFCGFVSSLCSIVGSFSMLATAPVIFETQCSQTIDLNIVVVATVSAVLWLTCGVLLKDGWICVPNVACIIINTFTLGLTVYFPRDPAVAAVAAARASALKRRRAADAALAANMSAAHEPLAFVAGTGNQYGACDDDDAMGGCYGDIGGTC